MNFLAHYVLATRFLTPVLPHPAYAVGTALPDLLPLTADRARLRPARLRPAQLASGPADTDFERAVRAGVSVHLATDAAFHKTQSFAEAQAEVSSLLAQTPFHGMRVRRFFIAHVLTELALDAVLLRADPALADRFYAAFTGADAKAVARWGESVTGQALPELPMVLTHFAQTQYLRHYAEDDGVATGLSRLCRRARQDTFEGENYRQLVAVVGETVGWLAGRAEELLSETSAKISAL